VQDLLDATADKHVTSCSVESNLGLGNRSNTFKSNVIEENDSLVTARSPPWKAARADVKRTITPLKQNLTDVKRGVTDKASEGKNGSCGMPCCIFVGVCNNLALTVLQSFMLLLWSLSAF